MWVKLWVGSLTHGAPALSRQRFVFPGRAESGRLPGLLLFGPENAAHSRQRTSGLLVFPVGFKLCTDRA